MNSFHEIDSCLNRFSTFIAHFQASKTEQNRAKILFKIRNDDSMALQTLLRYERK